MKLKDEICSYCPLQSECKSKNVCAPLMWINGNAPRKEPLLRDLAKCNFDFQFTNYNDTLAELITDKEQKTETVIEQIKRILLIQDLRARGIEAMVFFQIPRKNIAKTYSVTEGRIWQIIKKSSL